MGKTPQTPPPPGSRGGYLPSRTLPHSALRASEDASGISFEYTSIWASNAPTYGGDTQFSERAAINKGNSQIVIHIEAMDVSSQETPRKSSHDKMSTKCLQYPFDAVKTIHLDLTLCHTIPILNNPEEETY